MEILTAGTSWRNLIVVELTTDSGLMGFGEATIEYGDSTLIAYLLKIFARAVRGRDPLDVEGIMAAMIRADYCAVDSSLERPSAPSNWPAGIFMAAT